MHNDFLYQTDDIGVRGLSEKEVDAGYHEWFLNREVCRHNSHAAFSKSEASCRDYVKSLDASRHQVVWAVYHLEDVRHIGNISLQSIDWINRNAELALLFGEPEYWGRGYAFQAAELLLSHGFETLNLHRIHCGTASTNLGMMRLAEKLGMEQEGIRRQALFLNGDYADIVEYGLLRSEFED